MQSMRQQQQWYSQQTAPQKHCPTIIITITSSSSNSSSTTARSAITKIMHPTPTDTARHICRHHRLLIRKHMTLHITPTILHIQIIIIRHCCSCAHILFIITTPTIVRIHKVRNIRARVAIYPTPTGTACGRCRITMSAVGRSVDVALVFEIVIGVVVEVFVSAGG